MPQQHSTWVGVDKNGRTSTQRIEGFGNRRLTGVQRSVSDPADGPGGLVDPLGLMGHHTRHPAPLSVQPEQGLGDGLSKSGESRRDRI